MANLFVAGNGSDSGNGSSNAPFRSIGKAISAAAAGDTIWVRDGTYHEAVVLNKKGLVVKAEAGHKPVIDGRYGPELFGDKRFKDANGKFVEAANQLPHVDKSNAHSQFNAKLGNWVVDHYFQNLVDLAADDVVIDGIIIRNSAGRLLLFRGNSQTARNCRMDFSYHGAVQFDSGRGGLMENCTVTRASVKYFDWGRSYSSPMGVDGAVKSRTANSTVRNCCIAYCYGQGLSAARGSTGMRMINNVVHSNRNVQIYVVHAPDAYLFGNVTFAVEKVMEQQADKKTGHGLLLGDEKYQDKGWPRSRPGPVMANNLIIASRYNGGLVISGVNANQVSKNTGRSFIMEKAYIGYNTIIGLASEHLNNNFAAFFQYEHGAPHVSALIENNLFLAPAGRAGFVNAWDAAGFKNVVFRANLFCRPVTAYLMEGNGQVIPVNGVLANPYAAITSNFHFKQLEVPDPWDTSFDEANYRPVANSVVVGRGSARTAAGGITPPAEIEKDREGLERVARPNYDVGQSAWTVTEPGPVEPPEPPPPDPEPEPPPSPDPEPEPDEVREYVLTVRGKGLVIEWEEIGGEE